MDTIFERIQKRVPQDMRHRLNGVDMRRQGSQTIVVPVFLNAANHRYVWLVEGCTEKLLGELRAVLLGKALHVTKQSNKMCVRWQTGAM